MNTRPRLRLLRVWLALAAVAAIASMLRLGSLDQVWTTYATRSPWGAFGFVIGGLLPVVAGTIWLAVRPQGATALLVSLLGLAWLAPIWIGPTDTPAVIVTIARLLPPLLAPAALHLLVIFPREKAPAPERRLVWAAWGVAILTGPVRMLVLDPFYLTDCWENCWPGSNLLLMSGNRDLADLLATVRDLATSVILAAAIAVMVRRRSGPSQALLLPTRLAIITVLIGAAWRGLAHLTGPERPGEDQFWLPFMVEALALGCVALSLSGVAMVLSARRARVERLVTELTSEQAPVRDLLSRRLDDDALQVAYWLPDSGHFVDAFGTRVEEPSGDRTTVQRGGETIAVIEHRRTDEPLVEILGPTGLLAIDNERLRAEVLARLADLRSSRARVVAAADETRRRLERDLHDGAQQMLLALSYELRLAGMPDTVKEATAALGDLRDLADGLHPAILEEGGLAPALEDLAERARVPLHLSLEELDVRPDMRPDVRNTVYAVVVAVLDGAAGPLVLVTTAVDGDLVVQVEGAMEIDRTHILDRVGALGGTVDVRDTTLRAVIPCAWSSPKTPFSPAAG